MDGGGRGPGELATAGEHLNELLAAGGAIRLEDPFEVGLRHMYMHMSRGNMWEPRGLL